MTLDRRLSRELGTAGKKVEEWKVRRDDLVREAHEHGASLREIAAAVGLSNPGVLRILRRVPDGQRLPENAHRRLWEEQRAREERQALEEAESKKPGGPSRARTAGGRHQTARDDGDQP